MSILIYAESWNGKFKKSSFEAVSYGLKLAKQTGLKAKVLTINAIDSTELYIYGAENIISMKNDVFNDFATNTFAGAIEKVSVEQGAKIIVMTASSNVNSFAPALSVKIDASLATGVISLPMSLEPFKITRKIFSNKAKAEVLLTKINKILVIANNSHGVEENNVTGKVEEITLESIAADVVVKETKIANEKVNLMDAEIVVSAGRGLKAAENWTMIENLAEVLNAATACSKPVSDIGWRSHEEHVGQTGKNISPNLYFAIGISGAIQHVAGINSSKIIVAINTDEEAPIFKVANYGIVGDAFEVIPKLTEEIKKLL